MERLVSDPTRLPVSRLRKAATAGMNCCLTVVLLGGVVFGGPAEQIRKEAGEVMAAEHVRIAESLPESGKAAIASPAFLKSIGIPDAWTYMSGKVGGTIAIVDTGVDFQAPELKPYLLPGKNLLNPRKPPQDDNGHGTAVAGVIAAVAEAGKSVGNQARWAGKILPIKALDRNGLGDEDKLTEGIRYAIEQGADIVVLALGLRRDAPELRAVVALAEEKGVLLVAASGNDAAEHGSKAAVQYPAAYSTVLAVAGSNGANRVTQSSGGQEIDLSAAWRVETLALGGGSIFMEGTSMAAPQAAAAAAMVHAVHPDWSPVRLREALRRTAGASASWNRNTGYGYLSAGDAVRADSLIDWREPNGTRQDAAAFPLGGEVILSWGSTFDNDWFVTDIPYTGVYSVSGSRAQLFLYDETGKLVSPKTGAADADVIRQWPVKKGRFWLKGMKAGGTPASDRTLLRLESRFAMSPDVKEPNDTAAASAVLPARTQKWTGSFDKQGDEDWLTVSLPSDGRLKLTVSTDTTRIDPELTIQPAGGSATVIDELGDGGTEVWIGEKARAGKYYIRIRNAVSDRPEAVIGTYTVSLEYITLKTDAYEPNDGALTATPLAIDKVYSGLIGRQTDEDWFKFTISARQKATISLGHIPEGIEAEIELKSKKLQKLDAWNSDGRRTLIGEKILPAGTYYVVVTANKPDASSLYGLRVRLADV